MSSSVDKFMNVVLRSKTQRNLYPWGANIGALCDACGLDIYDSIDEGEDEAIHARLKVYKVRTWMCTDTLVGLFAYFLDDEFVCISWQRGRKSDTDISFVDNNAGNKVSEFLKSFVTYRVCSYNLIDAECVSGIFGAPSPQTPRE